MKNKKNTAEDAPQSEPTSPTPSQTQGKSKGKPIGLFGVVGFLAVALVVAGVMLLQLMLAIGSAAENSQQHAQQMAASTANQVADVMQRYAGIAAAIGQDARIQQVMSSASEEKRSREAAQLHKLFPEIIKLRLLPPGVREVDTSESPQLGYASLALLRKAEKSPTGPDVELHQSGAGKTHVAVVRRIAKADSEAVLGLVHLALNTDLLQAIFTSNSNVFGVFDVQQKVDKGKPLSLLASQDAVPDSAPLGVIAIPGTLWQVAYWEPSTDYFLAAGGIMTLVLLVVLLLLLAVLQYLLFFSMGSALRGDYACMVSLVKDLSERKLQESYAARTRMGQATIETMNTLAHEYLAKRKARKRAKGKQVLEQQQPEPDALDFDLDLGEGDATAATAEEEVTGVGGISDDLGMEVDESTTAGAAEIPEFIFYEDDIRGLVGESINADIMYALGQAIGSEAEARGQRGVAVARDGRESSESLLQALSRGLQASGRDVVELGMVPTPVLYFATHHLDLNTGVMVTGGHHPAEQNGLKIVMDGTPISAEGLQALRTRVETGDLIRDEGTSQTEDILPEYINHIVNDIPLARPMKIVIDCGNGVTGQVAPLLLRTLGCEVVELYCEVDGTFPNHLPDPRQPDNLEALGSTVQEETADLGIAFDGDGDCLGIVDSGGEIVWPDHLLILFAIDILARQPGSDILFDVKSTRHLAPEIVTYGGRPIMAKNGHAAMMARLEETGGLLAGESDGHIYFKERWFGFDDGVYACARLLEILSADMRLSSEVFADLPSSVITPELNIPMPYGESQALMEKIVANPSFSSEVRLTTIDGLRAEFEEGWGVVKASPSESDLVFRFEADNPEAMANIQTSFSELISQHAPDLELPF